MLDHQIRGLLFHYKKNTKKIEANCQTTKSIQKHPDSICENDVRNAQNVCAYLLRQTIEWEVNYFTAKENCYFDFYFLVRVSKTSWFCQPWFCSFCICRYSPCCTPVKPEHYSVLWPRILLVYMVKWHNSGIINEITLHWKSKFPHDLYATSVVQFVWMDH